MLAQRGLGVGDAILHQRQRGLHELRIARRMAQVLREGLVGGLAHFQRRVVVAERAPGFGQLGLEMHGATQRGDGFLALAERAQREAGQRQRIGLLRVNLQYFRRLLAPPWRARARSSRVACASATSRVPSGAAGVAMTNYCVLPARSLISRYQWSRLE